MNLLYLGAHCRHGPKRPAYLEAFWKVVNWEQVSTNYDRAGKGEATL